MSIQNCHPDWLEAESIYIIREVVAEMRSPALLFSDGEDSVVLLVLAAKAFRLGGYPFKLPFKPLHVDAGHNYPGAIQFRDEVAACTDAQLVVGSVGDFVKRGTVVLCCKIDSRNTTWAVMLVETVEKQGFGALMGGARRNEEKARVKERVFSSRDEFRQWDPKSQRPELWSPYNTRLFSGGDMYIFPISGWTELDTWQYIARENLALPPIYYSHKREIVERDGLLVLVIPLTPRRGSEAPQIRDVHSHIAGDIPCTRPIASTAVTPEDTIAETAVATVSERSITHMDDRVSEATMEERKKAGYL